MINRCVDVAHFSIVGSCCWCSLLHCCYSVSCDEWGKTNANIICSITCLYQFDVVEKMPSFDV